MATLEDQYQKALRLYQEESQNDPFTEPYKSKYAARDILEELKARLSKQLDEDDVEEEEGSGEEGIDVVGITRARLAAVVYHLGVVAVETEELSTGEEHLNKALTIVGDSLDGNRGFSGASSTCVGDADLASAALLGDAESLLSSSSEVASVSPTVVSPLTVALGISCHNYLGILWSNRGVYPKAKQHLEWASLLYSEYQQRNATPPRTINSLFSSLSEEDGSWEESGMSALEKIHTHTLYYLAQVYGHMGMDEKSAEYCHSTLKRQLNSKDCDLVDWAVNAANLSQFYLKREKFRIARHLLSSASKVLSQYEAEVNTQETDCEYATDMREKYERRNADVLRCWGRYCLVLLQFSVDLAIPDDPSREVQEQVEVEEDTLDKQLEFLQLDVCDLESEVVAKPVKNFDEARPVFLSGLRWLTSARQHYSMDDHASDHVNITQEMSHLYKALAFFEPSEERQAKMHKRRIDLLTAVVQELNPRYYLSICRQINYELAETYSTMMDNKISLVGTTNEPTPPQAKKINMLATSSIQHFLHYLDSMKDTTTGEQPAKYSEDSVRPALVAWFHLGRLWSKLVSSNQQSKIQNLAQSLNNYKRVVEYCDENPECQLLMAQELAICREMVELLPLKMEQIRIQCR